MSFPRDTARIPRYLARVMNETERQSEERSWETAKTLAEALPYIQVYDRETVVIKYGGHAMGESAVARQFAADVVLLKLMGVNPVVVHGGGPQISAMLDKAGVKSSFVDGLRVTDPATMEVAEMVLSGAVNKEIAHWITMAGKEADVRGVGLSGKDAGLLTVEKTRRTKRDPDSMIEHEVDLGYRRRTDQGGSQVDRRPDRIRDRGLGAGHRPDRRGRGRPDLQRQRRHGGGRGRGVAERQADAAADRRGGGQGRGRRHHPPDDAGRGAKQLIRHRRRHRRHDPQAGDRHGRRSRRGSRRWSSWMAAARTPCWSSCSPSSAPAPW